VKNIGNNGPARGRFLLRRVRLLQFDKFNQFFHCPNMIRKNGMLGDASHSDNGNDATAFDYSGDYLDPFLRLPVDS
jgi:hypothetical protein